MIALPAALLANWRLIAAAAAVSASFASGWAVNGWRMGAELERQRAGHVEEVAKAAGKVIAAHNQARQVEAQREAARKEIDHVASLARARADADRRDADASHQRLLDAAVDRARAGGAAADSCAARVGPPAEAASLVLADVLGRADARAGELAATLDVSHAAGLACERAHDSVSQ